MNTILDKIFFFIKIMNPYLSLEEKQIIQFRLDWLQYSEETKVKKLKLVKETWEIRLAKKAKQLKKFQ